MVRRECATTSCSLVTALIFVISLAVVTGPASAAQRPRRSLAAFAGSGGMPSEMPVSPDHWHCGSDGLSKEIAYKNAAQNCPSLAAALNHCCAIHDDCYGQQLGQDYCDRQFCECNRIVTRMPTKESMQCHGLQNDACFVLQIFGFMAYGGSNYSDPSTPSNVEPVAPKMTTSIEQNYLELYSVCPFVNITLASCAYNYDLCTKVHSVDYCSNDLCNCMLDAAESDPNHKANCTEAVGQTCRRVLTYSSDVLASRYNMRWNLTAVGLLIAVVGVGIYLFSTFWAKWKMEKRKSDEGKYVHIHTVESARSVNPLLLSAE